MASYQRHLALRTAFSALESEAQTEFTTRLIKGKEMKCWRILKEKKNFRSEEQGWPLFTRRVCITIPRIAMCKISLRSFRKSEWCTAKSPKSGRENIFSSPQNPGYACTFKCRYPWSFNTLRSFPHRLRPQNTADHCTSHRTQQAIYYLSFSFYYGCESVASLLVFMSARFDKRHLRPTSASAEKKEEDQLISCKTGVETFLGWNGGSRGLAPSPLQKTTHLMSGTGHGSSSLWPHPKCTLFIFSP